MQAVCRHLDLALRLATLAARLSAPHSRITSPTAASAAEPENGRISTTPATSAGKPNHANAGVSNAISASIAPLSLSSAVAVRIAARYGATEQSVKSRNEKQYGKDGNYNIKKIVAI